MNDVAWTQTEPGLQQQIYRPSVQLEKTFIPARPKINIYESGRVFRVCAYCRVSTENDEQLSSFELQQSHYRYGKSSQLELGTYLCRRGNFWHVIEKAR